MADVATRLDPEGMVASSQGKGESAEIVSGDVLCHSLANGLQISFSKILTPKSRIHRISLSMPPGSSRRGHGMFRDGPRHPPGSQLLGRPPKIAPSNVLVYLVALPGL